jgi:hypothetical protein
MRAGRWHQRCREKLGGSARPAGSSRINLPQCVVDTEGLSMTPVGPSRLAPRVHVRNAPESGQTRTDAK